MDCTSKLQLGQTTRKHLVALTLSTAPNGTLNTYTYTPNMFPQKPEIRYLHTQKDGMEELRQDVQRRGQKELCATGHKAATQLERTCWIHWSTFFSLHLFFFWWLMRWRSKFTWLTFFFTASLFLSPFPLLCWTDCKGQVVRALVTDRWSSRTWTQREQTGRLLLFIILSFLLDFCHFTSIPCCAKERKGIKKLSHRW